MTYSDIILKELENKEYIDSDFIKKNKIPSIIISRMVKSGQLFKLEKGFYAKSCNVICDELHKFNLKRKNIVFSGFTALSLLSTTEFIPPKIEVTVPYGYKPNPKDNFNISYIKPDLWNEGMIEVEGFNGEVVRCYSYERVLIDFIRKNKMNTEFYFKAIGDYNNYPKKNIKELFRLAKIFNVEDQVYKIVNIMGYTR